MSLSLAALPLVVTTLVAAAPPDAALPQPAPVVRGLSLAEALEHLRAAGLDLVYSEQLVRPDMVVAEEPAPAPPRRMLDALLAEHGLAARDGPDGVVLVVAGTRQEDRGALDGTVSAQDTRSAMEGVEIVVLPVGRRVWSGRDGSFLVDQLPAGSYSVQIRTAGYLPQEIDEVKVLPGGTTTVVCELPPNPRFLREVVVTPSRYSFLDHRPEPRQFLDRSEVQQVPHLSDDPFRVVHRLPGVAAGDISARFAVRGGDPAELMVLLDGQQIYQPFHLQDFFSLISVIDAETTEGIEMLSGGFPVEYGDRMGGVLEVSSAAPRDRLWSLGTSLLATRALGQGTWGRDGGSWMASARYGYLAWVFNWLEGIDQGVDLVSSPAYSDLFASLTTGVGDDGLLSIHALASRDVMRFDTEDGLDEGTSGHSSLYLWSTLRNSWDSGLSARTAVSMARDSRDLVGSSENPSRGYAESRDDRSFEVLGLRQDWIFEPWRSHLLKWGFDVRHAGSRSDHASWSIVVDPLFVGAGPPLVRDHSADVDLSGWQLAAYTADRFRLAHGVTAEVGVRWDHQSWTPGDDQLSPRLNLVWESNDLGVLRASWGRFAQSQAIWELQVEDGLTTFFPAQWAEHRVLSWERLLESGFVLRVEAYRKSMTEIWPRFENLFEPDAFLAAGAYDRVRVDSARAEARGIELAVKSAATGRWSWWASYALSAVEDLVDGDWQPRSWDQRHAINFSINWQPGSAWNLNLAGVFHSGWPTTPVTGRLVQQPDGSWEIVPELGARNSARYASYRRLDLRASRTWLTRHGRLRFFVDVTNLTNTENARATSSRSFWIERGVVIRQEPDLETWVPILPSLGIVWEF